MTLLNFPEVVSELEILIFLDRWTILRCLKVPHIHLFGFGREYLASCKKEVLSGDLIEGRRILLKNLGNSLPF